MIKSCPRKTRLSVREVIEGLAYRLLNTQFDSPTLIRDLPQDVTSWRFVGLNRGRRNELGQRIDRVLNTTKDGSSGHNVVAKHRALYEPALRGPAEAPSTFPLETPEERHNPKP
jgi:hypothetical protein